MIENGGHNRYMDTKLNILAHNTNLDACTDLLVQNWSVVPYSTPSSHLLTNQLNYGSLLIFYFLRESSSDKESIKIDEYMEVVRQHITDWKL